MKGLLWAAVTFLSVSLPLVLFFYPVIDTAGPGWIGHVNLEFDTLKLVRVWEKDGRATHRGVLIVEFGAGILMGSWIFASIVLSKKVPPGRGGAV